MVTNAKAQHDQGRKASLDPGIAKARRKATFETGFGCHRHLQLGDQCRHGHGASPFGYVMEDENLGVHEWL